MKRKYAIVKRLITAFVIILVYAVIPIMFICNAPGLFREEIHETGFISGHEVAKTLTGVGRNENLINNNSPRTIFHPALEVSDSGIPDSLIPTETANRLCNQFSGVELGELFESEETVSAAVDKEPGADMVYPSSLLSGEVWVLQGCTLTAYCSCPMCCNNCITYTGTVVTEGKTVAVDPNVIPLGSIITIAGHDYVAEDTGVIGNWVDIYFDTHNECIEFGLQFGDVIVRPAN